MKIRFLSLLRPLRNTNKELHRIADCMEFFILKEYNYAMSRPKPVGDSLVADSIEYSEDKESLKDDILVSLGRLSPDLNEE